MNTKSKYNLFRNKFKINKKVLLGIIILVIIIAIFLIINFFNNKKVREIYLNEYDIYLKQGEQETIEVTILPDNKDTKLIWSSNNSNVSVLENGIIIANNEGLSTITVTDEYGNSTSCDVTVLPPDIEINSINLDVLNKELKIGETYQFIVNVSPSEILIDSEFLDTLTWESSNPDVVEVFDGKIKALDVGKSTITVKTSNGYESSCDVLVKENKILPTKIQLDIKSTTINIGEELKLNATIMPSDATNKEITWKSSNPSVLEVNNGIIIGLSDGYSVVTAKTSNGKSTSSIIFVKDKIEITDITIDKTDVTIDVGESLILNAETIPDVVDNGNLIWISLNPDIVTVDEKGMILGKNAGTTEVIVKSSNGITKSCNITVQEINIQTFDIRNNAIVEYYSSSTKKIKDIYKKYNCSKVKCYYPKDFETNLAEKINIYEYDEINKTKTFIKMVDKDMLKYNLIPYKIYYLEDSTNPKNNQYIKLTGEVRMIKIDGIGNIRDLGGYKADNGVLEYGKLYRGANPNSPKSEAFATNAFKNLGISLIFDLRESSNFKKQKSKMSSFEKMNSDTGYWLYSKVAGTRKSVSSIMQQIVSGKGVYYHCAIGRDRTGTVSYLLEGILGVPLEIRLDDYELSYLYRTSSSVYRGGESVKSIYKKINKYGGNNDQEKFINWFLSDSKDVNNDIKLINDFRKTMINGNPTVYKVVNKKCVAI